MYIGITDTVLILENCLYSSISLTKEWKDLDFETLTYLEIRDLWDSWKNKYGFILKLGDDFT